MRKLSSLALSIVIPVYNEERRIGRSLATILPYLKRQCERYEVIIVDDGSNDRSLEVVHGFLRDRCSVIRNLENLGKGAAVRRGVQAARYPWILVTDADVSTPIEELENFFPWMEDNDILIGSRGLGASTILVHQSFYKEWLGRLGNILIQQSFLPGISDTQCGFKLFNRKTLAIFKYQTIERWGFDFEILYLAKRMGYRIKEIPVRWRNDPDSKVRAMDYVRTFYDLVRVWWKILIRRYPRKTS